MSERTIIAVVTDLFQTGLTVEQQILVAELSYLKGTEAGIEIAAAETRRGERERKRASRMSRMSQDKRKEPKENNNILYINQGGSRGDLSRDNFDAFWRAYPRKEGKGDARKAYKNALKRATHDEIMAGVGRYVASKPDPKFTKHPAPWLNADRWLDETPTTVAPRSFPSWAASKYDYEQKYGKAEALNRYVEDAKRAAEDAKKGT